MTRSRYKRLAVLELSAGVLVSAFDVEVQLVDGQGIGWTLTGKTNVDSVGAIGLECPPDPDIQLCHVYVPDTAPPGSLGLLLDHFNLTPASVLQTFE